VTTGPGWAYLEKLGPATDAIRNLRYQPAELFDDVPDEHLAVAMRFCRSAAYSATQGEALLLRIILARHADDPDFDPDQLDRPTREDTPT